MTHDNVTDIVERLRAWEPFVSDGYEVPAAGQVMHEAVVLMEAQQADLATLRKQLENAREALEPSAATKYCYSGEFKQNITLRDEDGEEYSYPVTIEWTTIKEIMAAINARALEGQQP